MSKACQICGGKVAPLGEAVVLRRHRVSYWRCEACGFVQTEEPYWLADAYAQALSALDVGAVSRNLRLAGITQSVIGRFFEADGLFLDYGGGTGLFVRLMRDAGFDFRWLDKFAANIFARGFESGPGEFGLLTAFEVLEHLPRPVEELEMMLRYSRNILCTTVLLPDPAPALGQWWYYGLDHGQHVSFYTRRSLEVLADRFQLHLCSHGELHLLSTAAIKPRRFRFSTNRRVVSWTQRFRRRPSLAERDFQALSARRSKRSD